MAVAKKQRAKRFDWEAFRTEWDICEIPAACKALKNPGACWRAAKKSDAMLQHVTELIGSQMYANKKTKLTLAHGVSASWSEVSGAIERLYDSPTIQRYLVFQVWPTFADYAKALGKN